MKTRIFVTGATGFIGMNLVNRLLKDGYFVHALVRNPEKKIFNEHPCLKLIKGDLMDLEAIYYGMQSCSQVYHLAGYARTWAPNPDEFYVTHVAGTKNILEIAKHWNVDKVVVTSA